MASDSHELAWAAGFFDGEGYTGLIGNARGAQMQIPQVDRRPLDRFHAAVGGLGRVGFRPRKKWRDQWYWQVGSFPNVEAVLALLWPFLSEPKREQAERVLAAYRAKPHTGGALCRSGHNDWVLKKDGVRYCDTCYKTTRLDPNGPHRRSQPAIDGWKRGSGLCRQGHDNWRNRGMRTQYCETCRKERVQLARFSFSRSSSAITSQSLTL
jgi:hypothetical protein